MRPFKLADLKARIDDNQWQQDELRKTIAERDHSTARKLSRLVMRK